MTTERSICLAEETISHDELESLTEWILAGNRLTKSEQTLAFEKEFAEWQGCRHAVYVNSGSSANLLMIAALKESGRLRNNKAIAAGVSWVTTVAPLLQLGFDVRLCDCDPHSLSLDVDHLESLCRVSPPAVLILVHVLGHAGDMDAIRDICNRYGVMLLEDSCEALGSTYGDRKLGTLGVAGSFSFYYGHHISTIEGGMVVTDDDDMHQLMLSLRSHGWSRDLAPATRDALKKEYNIDDFQNLYTFYHAGFNFRSTDLQAYLGRSQLKKLDVIVKKRSENYKLYKNFLGDYFFQTSNTPVLSSFAYGTLIENRLETYKHLAAHGIECRPLICGNIARHPFWLKDHPKQSLPHADVIHDYGIYLPNHYNLSEADIARVAEVFSSVAQPYQG
ncbi:DegT/DnrJ/EryC1/StrS family aminotransferase [Acetobacter sp. TBRC 12305]|uniref:DegT/DnrJ/EryC1/StrS family aminotransferase n=1 Tax=Acetobacter garciniae TaxID=2817435 RepID=A0A939HGJ5_9PROT|nr:DegT/DnrJ/EryC1/StrS family aminotransferase [Acetobacter garciniae]MBO1323975.1 DegT/DnrJ/EryC1/StrS family aminotransferase [Acetobacter garciniae]MBX0343664.1 DegT/DnrJ/EryC1/StrS family aminotransferase [Acetobacter garciniae]